MKSQNKMIELIQKLKARNNNAYIFFEKLLFELKDQNDRSETMKKLTSSFTITQYAGFTSEEENLLSQIIEENLNQE